MSDNSIEGQSIRGRLLATLLSWSTLVQPEVALTRATRFLLALPSGHTSLDDLIRRSDVDPEPGGHWLTEVRGEEGGRTDLEYRWGNPPRTRVIVEAKIGHTLGPDQVAAYRARLGDEGLLVVLVPASRRREGEHVGEQLRRDFAAANDQVRIAVWTWDEVVDALEATLPEEPDVVQLRGLVDEAGALDIRPFDENELSTANESRFQDLWTVLDRASFRLFDATFYAQNGGYFQKWRWVAVGDFDATFTVGIGRTARSETEPWVWVRVPDDAHLARASQEALKEHRPDAVRDSGGLALPLALLPGLSGYELTQELQKQLTEVALLLREGVRDRLELVNLAEVDADPGVLDPLVGMPPFASADLLDSSEERHDDLDLLALQSTRHLVQNKRVGSRGGEPFAHRYWIHVQPYATFLSIGVGRTDHSDEPQPWCWLAVHKDTPHCGRAVTALEEAFPGQVVATPQGSAVPLSIPDEATGVEAFKAVVAQVERARAAIREVLGNNKGD